MVNRVIFFLLTLMIMAVLLAIGSHPFLAAAITILLIVIIYITAGMVRNKYRMGLLDDRCDPEAFLERTDKQINITGRNPAPKNILLINRSTGLIELGRFEEAKEILLSIDKSRLSVRNGSLFAYTANLISCYFGSGEIDRAEELFETEMAVLPPIGKKAEFAAKMLVAKRLFHLKRYCESREQFNKLLAQKISKRARMSILYYLARMDEIEGNRESAMLKYSEVAKEGNKLWIARQSGAGHDA